MGNPADRGNSESTDLAGQRKDKPSMLEEEKRASVGGVEKLHVMRYDLREHGKK